VLIEGVNYKVMLECGSFWRRTLDIQWTER